MDAFLRASKAALANIASYEKSRVIVGNRTCDLDSAVCALSQAFCEYVDAKEKRRENVAIIPLMNIPEKEYVVKTEVVYHFELHDIPPSLLTFRDQIDLKALSEARSLEMILVDHHDVAEEDRFLVDSVIEVIDHRPADASWPWEGRRVCLESVGSCATLVARNLLRKHPEVMDARLASLLRGAILIDTCNFSKEAARATPLDHDMIEALEKVGCLDVADRKKIYEAILAAKTDVGKLSPDDLMIRDLKIANGIPMVGFPMLVRNFLTRENCLVAVKRLAESKKTRLVILMGLEVKQDKVSRDIAVFSLPGDHLKNKITKALTTSTEPALELTLTKEISEQAEGFDLLLYSQGNVRATRKHILPIIRDVVTRED